MIKKIATQNVERGYLVRLEDGDTIIDIRMLHIEGHRADISFIVTKINEDDIVESILLVDKRFDKDLWSELIDKYIDYLFDEEGTKEI